MNAEEKRVLFGRGDLCPININVTDLSKHGIQKHGYLRSALFESHISWESQLLARDKNVFLGAYSYMNDGGYVRGPAFIGRFSSIGRRVSIGASGHPLNGLSSHPQLVYGKGTDYTVAEREHLGLCEMSSIMGPGRSTQIGHDVWLGDGAVVMAGVKVGTGCVVGANSVVTKDLAPYAIAVGAPARIIRFRFPDEICERLLQSEWWDFSLAWLRSQPVCNVFELLEVLESGATSLFEYSTLEIVK